MECKEFQDQLINEYVDKELGPEENNQVERHLTLCLDCREFFEAVQSDAVIPFKEAGEIQPDSVVWQRIQESIDAERIHSRGGFGSLANALALLLRISRSIFRVAFATALIFGIVVLAKWPSSYADPVKGYISEQMTFMNELQTGNPDFVNSDLKDYDVALEETGA